MSKYCYYCGNKSGIVSVGAVKLSENESKDIAHIEDYYAESNVTQPTNVVDKKQNNGVAIAGFILSLLGQFFIIGLILSIVGLVKSRQMNGVCKGFAIAGIVISTIYVIAIIVVVFMDTGLLFH